MFFFFLAISFGVCVDEGENTMGRGEGRPGQEDTVLDMWVLYL